MDNTLLDRVQSFLDYIEKDESRNISLDAYGIQEDGQPVARLMWGDVQLLVATVRAGLGSGADNAYKDFLLAAERGVAGWKRACTNQIGTISHLQEELRLQRIQYRELNRSFGEARSEIATLKREAKEAEDWQNEVAGLIPEDAEGINPEGAQEGIILDYIRWLHGRVKELERDKEMMANKLASQNQQVVDLEKRVSHIQQDRWEDDMGDDL